MKKRNPRKKIEQTETKKQENQGFVIRNRKKDRGFCKSYMTVSQLVKD